MRKSSQSDLIAGRFHLLKKLGEGGMGSVFLARDTFAKSPKSQKVALKFLAFHLREKGLEAFRREFAILASLHHPHLVRVFDLGFDESRQQYFFTSEWLEGETLTEATEKTSVAGLVDIFAQIAEVLMDLHALGVLHNDLKPSNILLTTDGIKVLDFGLSSETTRKLLPSNSVHGTPGYIAPEIIRRQAPSPASDIFSLGMLMFRLFAGRLPFDTTHSETILKNTLEPIESLAKFRPDLPPPIVSLIDQMLANVPSKRPATMAAVLTKLEDAAGKDFLSHQSHDRLALSEPRFTGQERLFNQLDIALENAPLRHPNLVYFSGQPRSGKTRLLRECSSRLQLKNHFFISADCDPSVAPGLDPFGQLLGQLRGFLPPTLDDAITQFFPELAPYSETVLEAQEPKSEDRLRLYFAYTECLRAVTQKQNLVLALDNLDRCDRDGLDLLQQVLQANDLTLTIIATGGAIEMQSPLASLTQAPHCTTLPLPHFDSATLGHFISAVFPGLKPSNDVTALIFAITQGNPGVTLDLLHDLARNKIFVRQTSGMGGWRAVANVAAHLRQVQKKPQDILKSFSQLFKAQQTFLANTTLFSDSFSMADLLLLEETSAQDVIDCAQQSLHDRWLKTNPSGQFTWVNPAWRASLISHLERNKSGALKRQQQHQHLLAAYGKSEAWTPALFHALAAGDSLAASDLALRIAKQHLQHFALGRAEEMLNVAAKAERKMAAAQRDELRDLTILWHQCRGESDKALELLKEHLSKAKDGRVRNLSRLRICEILREKGRYREALAEIEKGSSDLKKNPETVIEARFFALQALCEFQLGNHTQARQAIDHALATISTVDAPVRHGNILLRRGIILSHTEKSLDPAQKAFAQAEVFFQQTNNHLGLASAHQNMAILASRTGDSTAELNHLHQALTFSRLAADLSRLLRTLNALGNYHFVRADLAEANKYYGEALTFARLLRNGLEEVLILANLARLQEHGGQFEAAFSTLDAAKTLAREQDQPSLQAYLWITEWILNIQVGNLNPRGEGVLGNQHKVDLEKAGPIQMATASLLEAERQSLLGNFTEAKTYLQDADNFLRTDDALVLQMEIKFLGLVQQKRQYGKIQPSDFNVLKDLIQTYEKTQNIYQYLRTEIFGLEQSEVTEDIFRKTEAFLQAHQSRISQYFDLQIDIYLCLFTQSIALGRPQAFAYKEKCEATIQRIAEGLNPKHREQFLQHPHQQSALATLAAAATLPQGQQHELETLRNHLKEANRLLVLCRQLEEAREQKSKVSLAAQAALQFLQCDQLAFYAFEVQTFRLRVAIEQDGSPWVTPEPLAAELAKMGETIFSNAQSLSVANLTVTPLFQKVRGIHSQGFETLPLGVLITSAMASPQPLRMQEGLEIFAAFLAAKVVEERVNKTQTLSGSQGATQSLIASHFSTALLNFDYKNLIGRKSEKMHTLIRLMERVIPTHSSVLILGESGVGKEVIAHTLQANGPRADKPYVTVNCGAIAPQLAESILFGHAKGAFTDASEDQQGLLTLADGGTVFLDEIGELTLEIQSKLLRVLQNGEIRPVGSGEVLRSHFRLIAATHRDLRQMVKDGTFREDLYFRINVVTLSIPPLRERREDIPDLVHYFFEEIAKESGKSKKRLTRAALKALTYHPWPGNVRQLKNLLETLSVLVARRQIDLGDLPPDLFLPEKSEAMPAYEEALAVWRRDYFSKLLQSCGGNVAKAAEIAKIRRTHLYVIIKKELDG